MSTLIPESNGANDPVITVARELRELAVELAAWQTVGETDCKNVPHHWQRARRHVQRLHQIFSSSQHVARRIARQHVNKLHPGTGELKDIKRVFQESKTFDLLCIIARLIHDLWYNIGFAHELPKDDIHPNLTGLPERLTQLAEMLDGNEHPDVSVIESVAVQPATKKVRLQPATNTMAILILQTFIANLSDDRLNQIEAIILSSQKSLNQKLWEVDAIIPIPPTVSASKLGTLFGVSKTAIQNTNWYKQKRKGDQLDLVEKRQEIHETRRSRMPHDESEDE